MSDDERRLKRLSSGKQRQDREMVKSDMERRGEEGVRENRYDLVVKVVKGLSSKAGGRAEGRYKVVTRGVEHVKNGMQMQYRQLAVLNTVK